MPRAKKAKLNKNYKKNTKLSEYPQGTYFQAGHLVETNSAWRTTKPVVDIGLCINCLICYKYCPDACINRHIDNISIDYDFCKGCGICAQECPTSAITMEVE